MGAPIKRFELVSTPSGFTLFAVDAADEHHVVGVIFGKSDEEVARAEEMMRRLRRG